MDREFRAQGPDHPAMDREVRLNRPDHPAGAENNCAKCFVSEKVSLKCKVHLNNALLTT